MACNLYGVTTMSTQAPDFLDFFKSVPDHRIDRNKHYSVDELLLLAFCAVIAGCSGWNEIERYGDIKLNDLRCYLPYAKGSPSDDTLRRFFRALDPQAFESLFIEWVKSFQLDLEDKVIALDGKTSRRSFDADAKPMHLISAFACEFGIVLGQYKTAEKSNEITAIPELINLLDLRGTIVTIDAMGCQHKIARQIIDKEADYLLALKGNQSTLCDDVQTFFEKPPTSTHFEIAEQTDKGHGRIEIRRCKVTEDIDWLRALHPQWHRLTSIVEIESIREIKGKQTIEKRYYISSLTANAHKVLHAVRHHWGIENKLHWVLDMTYGDDQSRIRKGNAPENMAIIKKVSINLIRAIKQTHEYSRISIKIIRQMAGWNSKVLDAILRAKFM
jgi:predicted transposase YbfD/YdcC